MEILMIGCTLQTTETYCCMMEILCRKFASSFKLHIYIEIHTEFFSTPPQSSIQFNLSEFYTYNNLLQCAFILISLYAKHKFEHFFFLFTSLALFASLFISIFDFFLLYQQLYVKCSLILLPVCLVFVCLKKDLRSS